MVLRGTICIMLNLRKKVQNGCLVYYGNIGKYRVLWFDLQDVSIICIVLLNIHKKSNVSFLSNKNLCWDC